MNKMTIDDVDLKNKTVFIRVDFNVPLDKEKHITDDRRIKSALLTIQKAINDGAKVILASHLGRPKGKVSPEFSLKPVADRLSELLNTTVNLAPDCIGPEVEQLKSGLKPGEVLLLENVRFHIEETKGGEDFARELFADIDVYVNDAFGTAHRANTSMVGAHDYVRDRVAGYLLIKEIEYLHNALEKPQRPFVAILGGAKISGKIDVINSLFEKVDTLIVGGGMVYTFFKAMNLNIGNSLLEEDRIDMAAKIIDEAENGNMDFILPADNVIADKFDNEAEKKIVNRDAIPDGWLGMDIGPKTIEHINGILDNAGTVVWNGPMGVFEMPNFAIGTNAVAAKLSEITSRGAVTIIGGGDSAAAIEAAGLSERMSHISTGGGASLEFLEGKKLPGLEALTDK